MPEREREKEERDSEIRRVEESGSGERERGGGVGEGTLLGWRVSSGRVRMSERGLGIVDSTGACNPQECTI